MLPKILESIESVRRSGPAAAAHVTVVGASKGQSREVIVKALEEGLRDFGENRVQEAFAHWRDLREQWPGVRLHLIGPLQTNKVGDAVSFFDVIHTVDREKLAVMLVREMERQGRKLPCFVQVNTGEEPQKSGVHPREASGLIDICRKEGLPLTGLMCVPPAGENPAPHFALLRKLAERNGLTQLSIGMSDDYLTAVRFGATHVRLGRVLFGER